MNWTPDKLTALATGYWQSAALIGAVELALFDQLDRPRTAREIAQRCGVQLPLLTSLLDALVSIDLLEKTADTYSIAAGAVAVLSRSSRTCMVDALRYNADLYRQWGKLADVVRSGEAAVPQAKQLGMDEAMTRRFVHGMESKARAFVPAIAPMIDLGGARTLLDVGSGPGTLSRTLAEQAEQLRVTLLDLPDVLRVAREICTHSKAHPRLDFHPANYRTDPLPGPFDAVVYAGALHQETLGTAEQLMQRFFGVLRPGGRVYIVDLMLDDTRTSPTFSALFQITMMLIQPAARVFSRAEVVDVLERAGFTSIVARQPESSPYRLVAAQKPES